MNCAKCNKIIKEIINIGESRCSHVLCNICEISYNIFNSMLDKSGCTHVVTDSNNKIVKRLYVG